jgi:thiamine monophosphate synthase
LKTVAIGGINTTNIDILLPYRPSMIAVIAGVFGQADIQHAARALANHF